MNPKLPLPSVDLLHQLFEISDGFLVYKARDRSMFTSSRSWKCWNSRRLGRVAGRKNTGGHVQVLINGKAYLAHRLIWKMIHGDLDEILEIDHVDEVKHNNLPSNLRLATNGQNTMNTSLRKDNKSKSKGVHWYSQTSRWVAQVSYMKVRHTKYFLEKNDAEEWARNKREELHGIFANHGKGCVNGAC